ncbi:hypothetical protein CCHR01_09150 [Colletotrichum chrysophilum]|uniref:Uncharacterized protein n=1 Tax=Colletotrichum chrysophilum TaxID=1836956 RepID=A0AAD9AII5_9PEZI|nr:hypothetical protein CCHR01_09150 [Colletotrichum chrysophilum]
MEPNNQYECTFMAYPQRLFFQRTCFFLV